MGESDHGMPAELGEIARTLHSQRAQASALELDRIKIDARRRAARRARAELNSKGLLMRSRLVVTAFVAGGILMLGGGAALGVSGLSSTRSASIAQYGGGTTTTSTTVVTNVVTPSTTTGTTVTTPPTTTTETTEEQPVQENLGENGGKKPAGEVAPAKQVSAESLPFTGYLAIPVLVLGLVFLGAGLVLRRSQRRLEADS